MSKFGIPTTIPTSVGIQKAMSNQGTESQFEETNDRSATGARLSLRLWRRVAARRARRGHGGLAARVLRKKHGHLPSEALEEAIVRFTRPEGVTTEQRNKHFHQLLVGGIEQKYRKADGTEDFEHIHAVDWTDATANDFCVVNQLPIRGQNDRRPDIRGYLNGFPLVLFELKNPYEEDRTRRAV